MEFSRLRGTETLEASDTPDIKWIVQDPLLTGTGTYAKSSQPPTEETEDTGVFQFADEYTPPYLPHPQAPGITYADSVHTMLTDRVREVLRDLLQLLSREARRYYIPVSKIEISGFVDPEENRREVVVTQWVKVSARMAMDYWDMLGFRVEDLKIYHNRFEIFVLIVCHR